MGLKMPHLKFINIGHILDLSVIILLVCSAQINGIVFRPESGENYLTSERESWEKEIGRSAESESTSIQHFGRDNNQRHYSEGGVLEYDGYPEDAKQVKDDKLKWKGWNYLDPSKSSWAPHEKTVSFQFLDDDGRYIHAPPKWPHDEYMLQFGHPYPYAPHNFGLRNSSEQNNGIVVSGTSNTQSENEWKKLRPQTGQGHFIGPGFYNAYNPQYTHQAITDGGITSSSSASASAGGSDFGDGQIPNVVSESATHGKLFPGGGYNSPYDYYRRKRLRLKIHPGLLAAPIAGFAAYKAVSAIASKPLLFELGWVGNKPNIDVGGGWGWQQPPHRPPYPYYPPVGAYPNPYSPVIHPIHIPSGGGSPIVPILRPKKQQQNPQRSAWWNPFAALTPRFRNKKEDRTCCENENESITSANDDLTDRS